MEESKAWKQEKGAHVFKGARKLFFKQKEWRERTLQWKCASRVGGVVWWLVWLERIETQDSGGDEDEKVARAAPWRALGLLQGL